MSDNGNSMVKRVGTTAERLAQKSYSQRMCRTECYPSCGKPGATYEGKSVEEWVDFIDDLGLEVQIVDGELNRGTPRFHSKMWTPNAHPVFCSSPTSAESSFSPIIQRSTPDL